MPPLPGEERLVTVYADIHYYFAPPSVRPVLHRFDKASYFYVYYNSTRGTGRIEVANNPGSAEQDAFNGSLDSCRIINSHKFPTLITLVVDGAASAATSPSSRQARDPEEWRLPSGDPRDTGSSKYRLHTLDIYFWAQEDAKLVVDNLKHLLQPAQLDVAELEREPEPEPEPERLQSTRPDAASPLVQNLENVAISDPAYQNGQTRNSQNIAQAMNLPPPPPQASQSLSPPTATPQAAAHQDQSQNYAPMAYNPAAPAAPEPIAHREDTPPPPPDDGQGTGLAAVAMHDQRPYQPGVPQSQIPGQPYQPGVPQGSSYQPGQPSTASWTGAPPSATQQRFGSPYASPPQSTPMSFSGPPTASSPTTNATSVPSRHGSTAAATYVPDPQTQMYHPSAQKPAETPGSQFYNALAPSTSPHKPLQHVQPQYMDYLSSGAPAAGGYSQFNYGAAHQQGMLQKQQQAAAGGGGSQYDVHSQIYRPTENEAAAYQKESGHGKRNSHGGKQTPGGKMEKSEKKVNSFFKKMEHKIGL